MEPRPTAIADARTVALVRVTTVALSVLAGVAWLGSGPGVPPELSPPRTAQDLDLPDGDDNAEPDTSEQDDEGDDDTADDETPAEPENRRSEARRAELALEADVAVRRGLAWLVSQQKQNGAWPCHVGYKLNYSYMVTNDDADHPGVTALACLAMMAAGHLPGHVGERGSDGDDGSDEGDEEDDRDPDDAYATAVGRGLSFILGCVTDPQVGMPGYIQVNGTRMYSHALATVFLAEVVTADCLAGDHHRRVLAALRWAAQMTVAAQNRQGGWGYVPNASRADVTSCAFQYQALLAARRAGVGVPDGTLQRARAWVGQAHQTYGVKLYHEDDPRPYTRAPGSLLDGAFLYQINQPGGSRTSWALTAAGTCCLQTPQHVAWFTDEDGDKRYLHTSIHYLRNQMPYSLDECRREPRIPFGYFFGHVFAMLAMKSYGTRYPEVWPRWLADVREKFVVLQRYVAEEDPADHGSRGYWVDSIGSTYATAMACLTLQAHKDTLQIFRR